MNEARVSAADGALRPITDREFRCFQGLVHEESGIFLSDSKRALLVGRLSRRLRQLGLASFGSYLEIVRQDSSERVVMLDSICTNETRFFREPRQFEYLERAVLPAWAAEAEAGRRPRRVTAWSAACSTGEEPFSLAMSVLAAFPPGSGWDLHVLATDLSTRVLAKARAATWPVERACEIPAAYRRRFMLRGTGSQEGRMRAAPEIRALVDFDRLNLNDERYAAPADLDLIFCRNVLIYFRPPSKVAVVERLLGHLAPAGRLFLGHSESLAGQTGLVRPIGPNVYARPEPQRPDAGPGSPEGVSTWNAYA